MEKYRNQEEKPNIRFGKNLYSKIGNFILCVVLIVSAFTGFIPVHGEEIEPPSTIQPIISEEERSAQPASVDNDIVVNNAENTSTEETASSENDTTLYRATLEKTDSAESFYGGDLVTIYYGIQISGTLAYVPEGSYTKLYFSKNSFQRPRDIDVSSNNGQIENVEISEDDDNYIITSYYRRLSGGYEGSSPAKIRLIPRQIIKNSEHIIHQHYYSHDGRLLAQNEMKIIGNSIFERVTSISGRTRLYKIAEMDDNYIVKDSYREKFRADSIFYFYDNRNDPRDRRVYVELPTDVRMIENSGWTYDENIGKWYKDLNRDQVSAENLSVTVTFPNLDMNPYDNPKNTPEKDKRIQLNFSMYVKDGDTISSTPFTTWSVSKSFYIVKVIPETDAYYDVRTYRKVNIVDRESNKDLTSSHYFGNFFYVPFNKQQLHQYAVFLSHDTISTVTTYYGKDDENERYITIKTARTDVPYYSYPKKIRLNINSDDPVLSARLQGLLRGTKAYGITYNNERVLVSDDVPITVRGGFDNQNFQILNNSNSYKSIEFVFPENNLKFIGQQEINKINKTIQTNVIANFDDKIGDGLKELVNQNKEPIIKGYGGSNVYSPNWDDHSATVIESAIKRNSADTSATISTPKYTYDTDVNYRLKYEGIKMSVPIHSTNGKAFFVNDVVETFEAYAHFRDGKSDSEITPENLNVYYLVPDGLEPLDNRDKFSKITVRRGYKPGYNLVIAKPKDVRTPHFTSSINEVIQEDLYLNFKVTNRMDIGTYRIYSALLYDNNQIDYADGKQYGILQFDRPQGVFANITNDAENRPESRERYTDFGVMTFEIFPPRELVAYKDVKLSTEPDNMYFSSVGERARIGDAVDYRLRLKNNATSPIKSLILLDILPYKNDKDIVYNGQGVYEDRGSQFKVNILSVDPQEKFDIYYTTDAVKGTTAENINSNWLSEVDDMSQVTMIKAVLKEGKIISSNEVYDIILHAKLEDNATIKDKEKAYNSYAFSLNRGLSFVETLKVEVEVNYEKHDVEILKTDGYNHNLGLEDVVFELYDEEGNQVMENVRTNRFGRVTLPNLIVGKTYILKEVVAANDYDLPEQPFTFTVSEKDNQEVHLVNFSHIVSFDVHKSWINGKENEVSVTLLADGVEKETVTLNDNNHWAYRFTDMPRENENGEPIIYSVIERNEQNGIVQINNHTYKVTVTGDVENGFEIVNQASTIQNTPVNISMNSKKDKAKVPETGVLEHTRSYIILALLAVVFYVISNGYISRRIQP